MLQVCAKNHLMTHTVPNTDPTRVCLYTTNLTVPVRLSLQLYCVGTFHLCSTAFSVPKLHTVLQFSCHTKTPSRNYSVAYPSRSRGSHTDKLQHERNPYLQQIGETGKFEFIVTQPCLYQLSYSYSAVLKQNLQQQQAQVVN
jgi:hypothetical protein